MSCHEKTCPYKVKFPLLHKCGQQTSDQSGTKLLKAGFLRLCSLHKIDCCSKLVHCVLYTYKETEPIWNCTPTNALFGCTHIRNEIVWFHATVYKVISYQPVFQKTSQFTLQVLIVFGAETFSSSSPKSFFRHLIIRKEDLNILERRSSKKMPHVSEILCATGALNMHEKKLSNCTALVLQNLLT